MVEIVAEHLVKRLVDREREFWLEIPELHLRRGARIAILGPTGSGKTTAMDLLALTGRPDRAGRFELVDNNGGVTDLAAQHSDALLSRLRGRHYGYVLQSSPSFGFLTVRENAALGQKMAGRRDRALVDALLQQVDLHHARDGRIADLSVGQRQKLAVVRALAHRPPILLCDEPTASLDTASAQQIMQAILGLSEMTQTCVVMITHDQALPSMFGFRRYVMQPIQDGRRGSVLVDARGDF